MTCSVGTLCRLIEQWAPPALAAEWDRIGLQIGDERAPVKGVLVALDATPAALEYAARYGCNFLLTHHPLFFQPLERISYASSTGRLLKTAFNNDVHIFAAHTNLDAVSPHGINDLLCQLLKLQQIRPVEVSSVDDAKAGMGRIGRLPRPQSLADFAVSLKQILQVPALRYVGDPRKIIEVVGVCSGAGASFIEKVFELQADCFVTGDLKYHESLDASQNGRALVDPGHFALETIVVPSLAEALRQSAREKNWSITVEVYKDEKDPFIFV